jgi:hypothetical protein
MMVVAEAEVIGSDVRYCAQSALEIGHDRPCLSL